jgi:glycosyltransferase involved in cell wall biosynthesis
MSLVSIIIPCYNYGWLLSETLDSILKQSYQQWECIIIDDGSEDNTRYVAESYQIKDSRFRYIYQPNGGMSSARNHGLRIAQGKYIQFLDSDDLLAPQKLLNQVDFLESNSKVDIVYSDVRFFNHEDPSTISRSFDMRDTPWTRHIEGTGTATVVPLVERNDIVINSPLTRLSLIQRAGLFDEKLRSVEDWEFWVRCAAYGANFKYLPTGQEAWALVRVHPTSTSQNRDKMLAFTFQMRQQLSELLKKIGDVKAIEVNSRNLEIVIEKQAIRDFVQGKSLQGFKRFFQLACITNKYSYYLRSSIYWFRNSAANKDISNY